MGNDKLYRNIVDGQIRKISFKEYDQYLVNETQFEEDVLNPYVGKIIESWEKERITRTLFMYIIQYKGVSSLIRVLYGPLKNSGINNNDYKRLQISHNVPCPQSGLPYYAIGSYNTKSSRIYCLMLSGLQTVMRDSRLGDSYSSLWFRFDKLCETNQKETAMWTDKVGRLILGIKIPHQIQIHRQIFKAFGTEWSFTDENSESQEEDFSSVYTEEEEIGLVDFTEEIKRYSESDELPRNMNYRKIAIEREKYTCELCDTRHTFRDTKGEEYFEGHHLIMYNTSVQRRFKYCLDYPENIICLCPNCHKKIHNSNKEDTLKMVSDLMIKHSCLIKLFGIKSIETIINDYIKGR